MPFLRDDNLTFHRFATDVSISGGDNNSNRRTSDERIFSDTTTTTINTPNTNTNTQSYKDKNNKFMINHLRHPNNNKEEQQPNNNINISSSIPQSSLHTFPSPPANVWTTNYKNSYTTETNDFQYIPSMAATSNHTINDITNKSITQNGSTAKLVLHDDDETNKQVS